MSTPFHRAIKLLEGDQPTKTNKWDWSLSFIQEKEWAVQCICSVFSREKKDGVSMMNFWNPVCFL